MCHNVVYLKHWAPYYISYDNILVSLGIDVLALCFRNFGSCSVSYRNFSQHVEFSWLQFFFLLKYESPYLCLSFNIFCRNELSNLQEIMKVSICYLNISYHNTNISFQFPQPHIICIWQTESIPINSGFSWFLLPPFLITIMDHERTIKTVWFPQ